MTTPVLKLGKNYRLQLGDGNDPEAFNSILGEQTLQFTTSPDKIDGSSKDDGDYKVVLYGQQEISLDVNGVTKLPDPGLARLDTIRKAIGGIVNAQIVDTANANDVKFAAAMSIGSFKASFDEKGPVTYAATLSLAAAPTTDDFFS